LTFLTVFPVSKNQIACAKRMSTPNNSPRTTNTKGTHSSHSELPNIKTTSPSTNTQPDNLPFKSAPSPSNSESGTPTTHARGDITYCCQCGNATVIDWIEYPPCDTCGHDQCGYCAVIRNGPPSPEWESLRLRRKTGKEERKTSGC